MFIPHLLMTLSKALSEILDFLVSWFLSMTPMPGSCRGCDRQQDKRGSLGYLSPHP